ncbi:MAG: RnfABCDGE type electron transport complex subunit D, partial [Gammaproteobacteria bacterium]|nr:RnfABCDGE type electron transport complex subunit D [Gammaproteobacteria bacterium]
MPIAYPAGPIFPRGQKNGAKNEGHALSRRGKTLEIASSPHVASGASVDAIMRNVVYALLPVIVFAVFAFGYAALL